MVPTVALAGLVAGVDTVCIWSWLFWRVFLSAVLGLLMVSCQPRRPPLPQPSTPSEPRFLPTLPQPQTLAGVGSTAVRAEQRAAFTAAEALRTSGQPLQARQAFADFVRRYPDSDLTDDALLALGHISATLEQYAQAVTYYRSLLERFPRSERVPEAYLGLGVALYYRQDYAQSLAAFQRYLMLGPGGASQGLARYYLGATAMKQQRYTDAIAELKVAVETSRDAAVVQRAREYIATTVRALLKVDALTTLAQQYATTHPGDLILERLVQEYRKTGDQAAEAEALRRLTTAFPNAPDMKAARARLQNLQALRKADQHKIGVLLPLSGSGARAGTRALRGIELALATAQEHDPTLQISLVVRDTAQKAAAAQDTLRALVDEERVIGVIGPLLSRKIGRA